MFRLRVTKVPRLASFLDIRSGRTPLPTQYEFFLGDEDLEDSTTISQLFLADNQHSVENETAEHVRSLALFLLSLDLLYLAYEIQAQVEALCLGYPLERFAFPEFFLLRTELDRVRTKFDDLDRVYVAAQRNAELVAWADDLAHVLEKDQFETIHRLSYRHVKLLRTSKDNLEFEKQSLERRAVSERKRTWVLSVISAVVGFLGLVVALAALFVGPQQ